MGRPVQEIFQGRGDKKGTGGRIGYLKRTAPPLFLAATCYLLLTGLPASRPDLWFPLAALTAGICMLLHLLDRRTEFAVSFLLSLFVVFAGAVQISGQNWIWLALFPSVILMTAFYPLGPVLGAVALLALLVPCRIVLELAGSAVVAPAADLMTEASFLSFLAASTLLSSLIFGRLKGQQKKASSELDGLRDRAQAIVTQTGMESLNSDEVTSHYFASMLKTDEEIGELLLALKKAVFADAVNLFVPAGGTIGLRCSSEDRGGIIISGHGVIGRCLSDKKPFAAGEAEEKKIDLGYLKKNGKSTSIMAFPVTAGATCIGVLAADSSRYHAFGDVEQETGKMFASQVEKMLERERVYLQIKRDHFGLKVLREESSTLLSSLDATVVVRTLCEGAEKIVSSKVIFFSSEDGKFRMIYRGDEPADGRIYDLKGTFINMVAENMQPVIMSDVTSYKIPILPLKAGNACSIAAIPLMYESTLMGIFVAYSEEKNFLSTFQMDMLKVICNQASTSLANARLHAAIEKMATTDGLTGLYNHRVFQEKLSGELDRSARSGKPVSLLLTDIDFFKKINDTYGHPVGDLVLKGVSAIIREAVRTVDIPARYGGEEFAVVLPDTDSEGALQIAERLRKTIGEKGFAADGKSFNITISIGIAVLPADARSKEELIEKADQALYHAKHNGRNRCVLSRQVP